jgi:uncharacterized membrane protein
MRKVTLGAFMLVILLTATTAMVSAQTRSVFWRRWDVQINNVDTVNNQFDVEEIYDIAFTGSFRFGSRVIPLTNLEDITNIQIYENDTLLRQTSFCSETQGTFCVQDTDEGRAITYYFSTPATDTNRKFRIRYTVVGALRVYEGGDQLWWIAVPQEHFGFSIGQSQITVQLPPGFAPREGVDPVETYGVPGEVKVSGTTITAAATRQITGNESFEIRVQYPHDPNARITNWQPSFDERRAFEDNVQPLLNIGVIGLALLIGLGGPLAIFAFWYTQGRDPKIGPVPEYITEPPSDLPPAVVGTLLDEQADLRDVMSTLIHLGTRGYLVMQEDQQPGLLGIGTNREFTFKRTDQSLDGLRKFEQRLMNNIFSSNLLARTLNSLKNKFYTVIPLVQNDIYTELVKEGLFTEEPSKTRNKWGGIGFGILVLAGVLFFLAFSSVEELGAPLLCIPLSIGLSGIFTLILGQQMPAKTLKGVEEAAKWRAFLEYLRNLEKYDDVKEASENFDKYLAYAVAFGLDRSWIRKFSQVDDVYVPIPSWYYPTYMGGPYQRGYNAGSPRPQTINWGGGVPHAGDLAHAPGEAPSLKGMSENIGSGLEAISSGISNMLESASRVMTSQPQQSSSSGRWSSGGRSFSGGGSRGGGGSGGGSSGFG